MKTLRALTLCLFCLGASLGTTALMPAASAADEAATKHVTLAIKGMVTDNCPVLVKAAVSRIVGVRHVTASLETKRAVVEYNPQKTSPAVIQRVIKDKVGFDSDVVE